jgi:hypothetical protein
MRCKHCAASIACSKTNTAAAADCLLLLLPLMLFASVYLRSRASEVTDVPIDALDAAAGSVKDASRCCLSVNCTTATAAFEVPAAIGCAVPRTSLCILHVCFVL